MKLAQLIARYAPQRGIGISPAAVALAGGFTLLIVLATGCAPAAGPAEVVQRPVRVSPPARGLWRMERDYVAGRLDADTRARHHLPASLDRWGGSPLVFREDFERFNTKGGSGWRRIGLTDLRALAEPDGNHYLTLTGVPDGGPVGFARELPASVLAGRPVLCQVKTRLSNAFAARRLGMPTLEFVVRSDDGTEVRVPWPLAEWSSPGWEQQQFVWSAPAEARRVVLRLVHERAVASVWFDDLVLRLVDPSVAAGLLVSTRLGDNILPGGDFEVGVKRFTVTRGRDSLPAEWHFDADAVAAGRSLFIPLSDQPVRVTFGPLVFARTGHYVLTFQAKGSPGLRISARLAGLPEAGRLSPRPLTPEWQRHEKTFHIPRSLFGHGGMLELRLDKQDESSEPQGAWLDAVALTRGVAGDGYSAPNECELGIVDEWDDPLDLARALHLDQSPELVVLCINYSDQPRTGVLAIDVTDGLDRVVLSQTVRMELPARGPRDHTLALNLPRGYYRVLATLWPGPVGQGQPLSQAERAVALLNVADPVPRGAPCGLDVSGAFCSQRLTQLGFGWVRCGAEAAISEEVRDSLQRQALEVLLVGHPPAPDDASVLGSLLIGIERSEAGAAEQTAPLVEAARDVAPNPPLPSVSGDPVLIEPAAQTAHRLQEQLGGSQSDARAVLFEEGALPETIDEGVARLQALIEQENIPPLWDLAVPLRVVSNYLADRPAVPAPPPSGVMVPLDADPAWEASLTVRRYVLRLWAGLSRVCFVPRAAPVRPARVNPMLLSEYDHSPTPLVPALDYMNDLLNSARPLAWFDLPGEVRVLCFESGGKEGGTVIGVMWRPFGSHPTWVRLAGLAGVVDVRNLFGSPETFRVAGEDLLVPASGFVLYLLCPEESRALFLGVLGKPGDNSQAGGPPAE